MHFAIVLTNSTTLQATREAGLVQIANALNDVGLVGKCRHGDWNLWSRAGEWVRVAMGVFNTDPDFRAQIELNERVGAN